MSSTPDRPRALLRAAAPVLAACLAAIAACRTSGGGPGERSTWTLVGIKLDAARVADAGAMPVYREERGPGFLGAARAVGTLRISAEGTAVCSIKFIEPVVGLGGRRGTHTYDVVAFVGDRAGGDRFVARNMKSDEAPIGIPTEMTVSRDTPSRCTVTFRTRDRAAPYAFEFDAYVVVQPDVPVPFAP